MTSYELLVVYVFNIVHFSFVISCQFVKYHFLVKRLSHDIISIQLLINKDGHVLMASLKIVYPLDGAGREKNQLKLAKPWAFHTPVSFKAVVIMHSWLCLM